jgi:hypothetical protein
MNNARFGGMVAVTSQRGFSAGGVLFWLALLGLAVTAWWLRQDPVADKAATPAGQLPSMSAPGGVANPFGSPGSPPAPAVPDKIGPWPIASGTVIKDLANSPQGAEQRGAQAFIEAINRAKAKAAQEGYVAPQPPVVAGGKPMSLLEAIQAAQKNAAAEQSSASSTQLPFQR